MEVKHYKNLKEAFETLFKPDKNYIMIKHSLMPGEIVKIHLHKKANEWVVIDNGEFIAFVGNEEQTLDLKNEVVSIMFPQGVKHTIRALVPITYYVIRDCEDESVYVE